MASGQLQRHVMEQLQPAYSARYRTMVKAIHRHLVPLGVRLPQMERDVVGGYFIWLTLPAPLLGRAVAQRAREEENVVVAQGDMFEVGSHDMRAGLGWAGVMCARKLTDAGPRRQ